MAQLIQSWVKAFRLRTLPLAISCIGMGGFIAASMNAFRWDIFLLCIITTVFLQILSNLSNDYGDSVHGADSEHRVGPVRTVQSGVISPSQMRTAMGVFVALCLASGVTLLWLAFGWNWTALLFFFGLGVVSILAAIAYTVGHKPYGYAGLGDLAVLIFFGVVGVMGSVYLFTHQFAWLQVLPALSCGFFSMGVLNVNNIRDIESDRKAGKFSIPVRIGRRGAIWYHWSLLAGGIFSATLYTLLEFTSAWQFLFLVTLPLFIYNGMAVEKKDPSNLDPFLRQLALSTLVFVTLFGIGLLLI
ncbi:MAG: 1,4-dihydroxy-2-naphthoate polyprenyltransferase [Cyclobacteriaceae bacterium]